MVNIHTQHVQSMEKYISTLKSENALAPVEELTGPVEVTAPEEAVTTTNTDVAARGKDADIDNEIGAVSRKDEHVEVMA